MNSVKNHPLTRRQALARIAAASAAHLTPRVAWANNERVNHLYPYNDISQLTASQLSAEFAKRTLSPVETSKALLDRIDAAQTELNTFASLRPDVTLDMARASEQRWARNAPLSPLDGVPVSIKDGYYKIKNWPAYQGSLAITDTEARANEDTQSIANLRAAGMVFLGTTTMPDFGMSAASVSSRWGVTRNPWSPSLTTGGSSSGAAAAAAARLGPIHMGTDGGGSIRGPAAWTGTYGLFPGSPKGPITRTVRDAAMVMTEFSRANVAKEWTSRAPYPHRNYTEGLEEFTFKGLKVGYWPFLGGVSLAIRQEVASVLERALKTVRDDIASDIETIPPLIKDGALRSAFVYALATTGGELLDELGRERIDLVQPDIRDILKKSDRISGTEKYWAFAKFSWRARALLLNSPLKKYDVILAPSIICEPFPAELYTPEWYNQNDMPYGLDDGTRVFGLMPIFNHLGYVAASIPCGFTQNGLPVGLQAAVPGGDGAVTRCLALSRYLERLFDIKAPYPR